MIFEYTEKKVKSPFLNSVLRLSKNPRKCGLVGHKISSCERNYLFLKDLIRPRIRHDLLLIGELLTVSQSFLEELNERSKPVRPAHRLESGLNLTAGIGWLLPNLSCLPGLSDQSATAINYASIEIKPKSGILPTSDCLSTENVIKSNTSRFQMMQSLKLLQGKISSASRYDPLDLFSAQPERMVRSIQELIAEPQNNFRLSINQNECISQTNRFDSSSMNQISYAFGTVQTISDFAKILVAILINCGVLGEVKKLQQLDRYDIENIYLLFRHLENPQSIPHSSVRQQAPCKYLPDVRCDFV